MIHKYLKNKAKIPGFQNTMNYTNLQLLQYNNPPKNKPQPPLNSQHPSY